MSISAMEVKRDAIMYLLHVHDLQSELLSLKGLQPCSELLPWVLSAVACGQQELSIGAVAATVWHTTASAH